MPYSGGNPPQPSPMLSRNGKRPLVWAFIPYVVDQERLTAETYDTEQTKAELAQAFNALGLAWVWQPVVLNGIDTVTAHVMESVRRRPTVVFNFCDGVEYNGIPGVSVVRALERAGIPFTGASSRFYEISTSKLAMKRLFEEKGVPTPAFVELPREGAIEGVRERLGERMFVKPDVSSASYGISLKSRVSTDAAIAIRRDELKPNFPSTGIFVERFVEGDEFTVFVGGYWDKPGEIWSLPPARRAFADSIPIAERFLSYDRYWAIYQEETPPAGGGPFYTYESVEDGLAGRLTKLARRAFLAVDGFGYARVDIRRECLTDELYVLEVNANCGLSEDDQTSTGSILKLMGWSFPALLNRILEGPLHRTMQ